MHKLTAIITVRPGDQVEYWLNATVSVKHLYQHVLAAVNAKNLFDALTPQQQRTYISDLITENLTFS